MVEDGQLLRLFVKEHSEEAFAELVRRHVNLVYFAALRRVGNDRHLASDVTQRVFTDLARKAPQLQGRSVLTGWLYTSTRFAAAQVVRTERRRRTHEQEAQSMHELHSTIDPDWEQLRPVIDDAMDDLTANEREVVLLRFFENLSLADVGAKFSVSADAARMRVDRALDKLRGSLARRGVSSTSAALAAVFASQSGMAAPAGLVDQIVAAAIHQAGVAMVASIGLWKIITGIAIAALGIGLGVHFHLNETRKAEPATKAAAATETILSPTEATRAKASEPSTKSLPVARKFDRFTSTEKTILKKLWNIQKLSPDLAGIRSGLKPGTEKQDYVDFEISVYNLQTDGLVGIGAKKGVVFLTNKGHAFCEAHAKELDAYNPNNLPTTGSSPP